MLASIPTFPTRIRSDEGVIITALVLMLCRLEITVIFKTRVATHPITRCHTICLLSIQWASIWTVILLVRILALVQEVVCYGLVHDATLSADESATLRHKWVILMVLFTRVAD